MTTSDAENVFWNNNEMVAYFESKPADPRIVGFIDNHFTGTTNMQALDLGCGGGRHSELLASRGFAVSSVDVNPAMIAMTTERLRKANLQGAVSFGSILGIPYPDSTFDVVVTTGVLHQAKNGREYDAALKELSRVVKVGGFVLLNIFTDAVWDDTYRRVETDVVAVVTHEGLPMTLLSKTDFNERMQRNSFVCVEDHGEDIKQENTGPRAVYRANYQKLGNVYLDEQTEQDK